MPCEGNYEFDPQRGYVVPDMSGVVLRYGLGENHVDAADSKKKVKFIVEHPNCLFLSLPSLDADIESEMAKYDLIYNICPYTTAYLNEKYNTNKIRTTFFPLPPLDFPTPQIEERPYSVFYSGHNISDLPITGIIHDTVRQQLGDDLYNALYAQISIKSYEAYINKMNIYGKTKICIVHNLLTTNVPNKPSVEGLDVLLQKHLPWLWDGSPTCPQLKSRVFEGASAGCILLVYKDAFNIIENYFKEGRDFLYFTDAADLNAKIEMVLHDLPAYAHLGLNAQAHWRANYTFQHFLDTIQSQCINC
jgi:hypothetical protein